MATNRLYQACCTLIVLLLIFTLSSCADNRNVESDQLSAHEQRLVEANKALTSEVKKLQMKLDEKQNEIKKLILSQQQSSREVVRSKAKLRSHSSKAETVANIAEVKTMLKVVNKTTMDDQLRQLVVDTEQMVMLSVAALNKGDVDKAFDLSNKAQQLIQPIRTQRGGNLLDNGSAIVFVDPLLMKVSKTCNVRTDPGMQNDVRFTLERGTEIKALAYVNNWIQVESDKKEKGWVYYKLLEIVP